MCLIYLAWRRHGRHRLVVAANRDEFHARPALPAHWWADTPGVLAGRDVEAGESRSDEAPGADIGSDLGRMQWRSSRFILGSDYGTRTSTVVLLDAGGAGVFVERSFDASGAAVGDAAFELELDGASREIGRDARLAGVPGRPAPTGSEWKEARNEP